MQKIKQLYSVKTFGFLLYGIIMAYAAAIVLQMFAKLDSGKFWFEQIHWLILLALVFLYVRRRWIIEPYLNTLSGDEKKTNILKELIFWIMLLLPWFAIISASIILFFVFLIIVGENGHYLP